MSPRRHPAALVATAVLAGSVLLGACDPGGGTASPSEPATGTPTATATAPEPAPVAERCLAGEGLGASRAVDPLAAWACADAVVVAAPEHLEQALPVAAALGGPVVAPDRPDLDALVARLGSPEVVRVGPRTQSADLVEADRAWVALADDEAGRLAGALLAARDGLPLVVVPPAPTAATVDRLERFSSLAVAAVDGDATALVTRLRGEPDPPGVQVVPVGSVAGALGLLAGADPTHAWAVPAGDAPAVLRLGSLAAIAGHAVVAVPGLELLVGSTATRRLAALAADGVPVTVPVDAPGADAPGFDERLARDLAAISSGTELPGGGWTLDGKRFVALYGTPGTASLGVLGEQPLDETVARAREAAAAYADGTVPVVPTLEVIATVASASATEDGDYSYAIPHDVLREWVDRAADEGLQVVLDLQSGRTDFLTQARALEEFLVQPHVGLALDPEWRLRPDQVHLRQIGSVAAEEVNAVADWLVELVRDNDLPHKMLVLHQFRNTMLPDRDAIRVPDELLVVLHMDGQGSLASKYGTYRTLFGDGRPIAQGMVAGWKNFHDEDAPMATPQQVLALDPRPVFVSFQ